MIALIDYGAGNVRSVQKALEAAGGEVRIALRPEDLLGTSHIVLPGVGAFGDCMAALKRTGLADALHTAVRQGTLLLGICVGLQVLFEAGEEMGEHAGLGMFPGRVVRFPADIPARGFKVPHTGWNLVEQVRDTPLLAGLPERFWAYFNHAYVARAQPDDIVALTDHGGHFPSVVARPPIWGVQFHPEKSQSAGLAVLRNFVRMRP
ncbi:MAG: imidazole glycerol phosphate synthase subunit HisH [Chloroflexia bacterium]